MHSVLYLKDALGNKPAFSYCLFNFSPFSLSICYREKSVGVSVSFRIRPGQAGLSYVSAFQGFTTFGCSVGSEIWDELFFRIFSLCH